MKVRATGATDKWCVFPVKDDDGTERQAFMKTGVEVEMNTGTRFIITKRGNVKKIWMGIEPDPQNRLKTVQVQREKTFTMAEFVRIFNKDVVMEVIAQAMVS